MREIKEYRGGTDADRERARVCAGLLTTCPAVSHLCTPEMAEQFAPIIASLLAEVRAEATVELAEYQAAYADAMNEKSVDDFAKSVKELSAAGASMSLIYWRTRAFVEEALARAARKIGGGE